MGTISQERGVVAEENATAPASSTDNAIPRWNGTDASAIQDSGVTIDDSDNVAGVTSILFGSDTEENNKLSDYEEGTWDPVLSDGTNDATSDANTKGAYTKIGNRVFFNGRIVTSSLGSVSGAIRITGLPFAVKNDNSAETAAVCGRSVNLAITAGQVVTIKPVKSTTYLELYLWDATTGNTDMQDTEWTADGGVWFEGSYITS